MQPSPPRQVPTVRTRATACARFAPHRTAPRPAPRRSGGGADVRCDGIRSRWWAGPWPHPFSVFCGSCRWYRQSAEGSTSPGAPAQCAGAAQRSSRNRQCRDTARWPRPNGRCLHYCGHLTGLPLRPEPGGDDGGARCATSDHHLHARLPWVPPRSMGTTPYHTPSSDGRLLLRVGGGVGLGLCHGAAGGATRRCRSDVRCCPIRIHAVATLPWQHLPHGQR